MSIFFIFKKKEKQLYTKIRDSAFSDIYLVEFIGG